MFSNRSDQRPAVKMPKKGARSLLEMAISASARNVRGINDIGQIPYELIASVLAQVTLPQQLHTLETNSPHIMGRTADIWRKMIERDVPHGLEKLAQFNGGRGAPNDPSNWYKLYTKLKKDADRKQKETLAAFQGKLQSTPGVKGGSVAKDVGAAGAEGSMTFRNTAPPRPSDIRGGRRTGNYTPVQRKGFFDRIKHERTKEALSKQHGLARTPLPKWQAKMQVSKAPTDMVMDIKDQRDREREATVVRAPKKRASKPLFAPEKKQILVKGKESAYDMVEDREDRLRALKAGKTVARSNHDPGLTEDFLEGDDDLFGEDDADGSGNGQQTDASAQKLPASDTTKQASPMKAAWSPHKVMKRKAPATLFHEAKRVAR